MKPLLPLLGVTLLLPLSAADGLQTRKTYTQQYGGAKPAVALDAAKDLPRYPAVAAAQAVATWKVKPGFRLEIAASEPQVRDPIAVTFDENGRMFVCEMIDYSERREETPHLGRISVLEDKDGDGTYETSRVFADNLPFPTGLIWAHGALWVGATPDLWRFKDTDGDGRADVREKVYTGWGTGLERLNVQALFNSFQWGQDNRVHLQSSVGNRGKVKCLLRPELGEQELAGRDFWFDPRTLEFGFEPGGAQYGMSFDNWGRKFACSNSDHLQFWVYDGRYAAGTPAVQLPNPRQSIAADGGAAEVYRISPDEPWRIIRTRWRIGGVVKGAVEGGGRVSGYFTGATGTYVYRGDAYGAGFVNNTFTSDSGGQLIHRKRIAEDGVSLIGRRPDDEQNFEFAASTDTWVRIVNFANAPDGCLHAIDMYREVIEHPWSIPEEIKQHLDLNNGNDRGRIYRLVPSDAAWKRRPRVTLGAASTADLVATLDHPNGWHRDAASRLLYERQDRAAVPLLAALARQGTTAEGRHHALGSLAGLQSLDASTLAAALADRDPHVRERAVYLLESTAAAPGVLTAELAGRLAALTSDASPRVRFQTALTAGVLVGAASGPARDALAGALTGLARRDHADKWIAGALLAAPAAVVNPVLYPALTADRAFTAAAPAFVAQLVGIRASVKPADGYASLLAFVAQPGTSVLWLRALGDGLKHAGTTIEQVDVGRTLAAVFTRAASTAADAKAAPAARLESIELLSVASLAQSREALVACLAAGSPAEVQIGAIRTLSGHASAEVTSALVRAWPQYASKARDAAVTALTSRDDRVAALLQAIEGGVIPAKELSAAQIEGLARHKNAKLAARAQQALASVLPPSRADMLAKYQPAVTLNGDVERGRAAYRGRCLVCHRADGEGMALGPDLNTVRSKGRDALLTAIIDPNREVAPQYIAYEVSTKDGNAYVGLIARDEASSLTLKVMGGAEIALPRASLKGSSSSGRSLMPEGLEAGMSVQEMADLLSYLEQAK